MNKWIIKMALNPYFLALYITIMAILFLPPTFNRYNIEPIGSGISNYKNPQSFLYFRDIDNDGHGEKIDSYYDGKQKPCVQIYTSDGGIFDQWNLRGNLLSPGIKRFHWVI